MPKYQLTRSVQSAQGYQVFEVEADSEEEAFAKFQQGEGDVVHEEIEVTDLGDWSIDDIELGDVQEEKFSK